MFSWSCRGVSGVGVDEGKEKGGKARREGGRNCELERFFLTSNSKKIAPNESAVCFFCYMVGAESPVV